MEYGDGALSGSIARTAHAQIMNRKQYRKHWHLSASSVDTVYQ